jgi:integrase/recombinase XerC
MNTTIRIFQRTDFQKKDGTWPIYLRFTQNRKSKYISLGISCTTKNWIISKNRISKNDPRHKEKNLTLDIYESKARQIILEYLFKQKKVTFAEFQRNFNNEHFGSDSFYSFILDQIVKLKDKFSPGTIKNYKAQLNKLKSYKKQLTFNEIDNSFMLDYENYLTTTKQNNKNTRNKSLSFIKAIVVKAVEEGIVPDSQCKTYKLGRVDGDREFLTVTEIEALTKLLKRPELKPGKANVLKYFLFCCYTGLRYQDVKDLRFKNIQDGLITLKMHKTKENVRVPLIEKAKALISTMDNPFQNQKIFHVFTDQTTNRYLKEIVSMAGIVKNISFHCSRHTFATNGLTLGIPLEVIKELLGHTDIKTTLIYAKLEDSVRKREMNKWE